MTDIQAPTRKSRGPLVVVALILLVAAVAAYWGIVTRARSLAEVTRETQDLAVPTVSVITAERGTPQEELTLPGTMQPFRDAPIYARTNGYLRRWTADIGTRVKAGQLLAEIDAPEIDQQLQQARADLATAEANARLAQSTAERYRDLIKTDSVSKQDLDNANGNFEARQAAVDSARFNVKRLEELQGFGRIEAPFAGTITARNVDVGALIGANTGKELFHIADNGRLRVFVNVPQIYSQAVKTGMVAELQLKEFPDRRFNGTLARTSDAIDVSSRTLLAEIDVDNPKQDLLSGSFAEVHLKLPTATTTLKVPSTALIFKADGMQVGTVDEHGKVSLASVTIGRDFGNSVEVVAGLTGTERIIANPPDSLAAGQTVRVAGGTE